MHTFTQTIEYAIVIIQPNKISSTGLKKLTKERTNPGAPTRKQAPAREFEEGAMSRKDSEVLGNI